MMKHLFIYPWIMAFLLLGVGICIGLIAHMLMTWPQTASYYSDAVLVMEDFAHALA